MKVIDPGVKVEKMMSEKMVFVVLGVDFDVVVVVDVAVVVSGGCCDQQLLP